MRVFASSFICAVAFSATLVAQQPERWCTAGSYKTAHDENVADLRWSLHELGHLKATDKDVKPLLGKVADASVFSLANIYSLRANFVQKCDIEAKQYRREMEGNERFITLVWKTASSPSFQTVIGKTKLRSTQTLELHSEIRGKLRQWKADRWKEQGEDSINDPLWIAASQLLGEKVDLNENSLKQLEHRFKIDPEIQIKLANASTVDFSSSIKEADWQTNLDVACKYYLTTKTVK